MASKSLKILIDQNVPFLGVLKNYAQVEFLAPDEFTPERVHDADALIVRTRTHCGASLLEGSSVRFVGTATIGTDHIDLDWCRKAGIEAVNAPGCNAPAVAQYVFGSLMQVINRPLRQYTIGVVGVGHVGSIVARWAEAIEMPVMLCDPPRQRAEGGSQWCTLSEIARKADIITFHTPLTAEGPDATLHLADDGFFASLRRAPIIINAARGPVVDTRAWISAIDAGICGPTIIDCWEGEPHIDTDLLYRAAIATPHIAGYSRQGKARASQAILSALCRHFGLPALRLAESTPLPAARSITPAVALRGYDPTHDSDTLKQFPEDFEQMRNSYPLRDELPERFSR